MLACWKSYPPGVTGTSGSDREGLHQEFVVAREFGPIWSLLWKSTLKEPIASQLARMAANDRQPRNTEVDSILSGRLLHFGGELSF